MGFYCQVKQLVTLILTEVSGNTMTITFGEECCGMQLRGY